MSVKFQKFNSRYKNTLENSFNIIFVPILGLNWIIILLWFLEKYVRKVYLYISYIHKYNSLLQLTSNAQVPITLVLEAVLHLSEQIFYPEDEVVQVQQEASEIHHCLS